MRCRKVGTISAHRCPRLKPNMLGSVAPPVSPALSYGDTTLTPTTLCSLSSAYWSGAKLGICVASILWVEVERLYKFPIYPLSEFKIIDEFGEFLCGSISVYLSCTMLVFTHASTLFRAPLACMDGLTCDATCCGISPRICTRTFKIQAKILQLSELHCVNACYISLGQLWIVLRRNLSSLRACTCRTLDHAFLVGRCRWPNPLSTKRAHVTWHAHELGVRDAVWSWHCRFACHLPEGDSQLLSRSLVAPCGDQRAVQQPRKSSPQSFLPTSLLSLSRSGVGWTSRIMVRIVFPCRQRLCRWRLFASWVVLRTSRNRRSISHKKREARRRS